MCRAVILYFVLMFFGSALQARAQFTIRAASDQAVEGWNRMEVDSRAVWVSPTVSLSSADILRAEPKKGKDGQMRVSVIFTNDGARKMLDLSKAQMNKLIAMVLDGKLIFAPRIRGQISKTAQLTGTASSGLPPEVVQRIVDSVKKK